MSSRGSGAVHAPNTSDVPATANRTYGLPRRILRSRFQSPGPIIYAIVRRPHRLVDAMSDLGAYII